METHCGSQFRMTATLKRGGKIIDQRIDPDPSHDLREILKEILRLIKVSSKGDIHGS